MPHFDCRVFGLPSRTEAANAFLWRALDARKNAISMVAQSRFSHRQLYKKGQADMLDMLSEIGVDFDADYPSRHKHGTFVRREMRERPLTDQELARIPERHRPNGPVLRSAVEVLDMPPFNTVANREAVIFDGAEPKVITTS